MPLIRIDHNTQLINDSLEQELVQSLLGFAKELHSMNDDQISIFTQAYSAHAHSTAAAEVDIRAKKAEYGQNPHELQKNILQNTSSFLRNS